MGVLLLLQVKMYRTLAPLLLLFGLVQTYPGGAPFCSASPGHGRYTGTVNAMVTNRGGNLWEVRIMSQRSYKGLVIDPSSAGYWESVQGGHKNTGNCVTHSNSGNKYSSTFTFRALNQLKPRFSGWLVYNYGSYAGICFECKFYDWVIIIESVL